MYQNKNQKNNSGFVHHALLGVLVVAITALAGIKVLTAIHAQTPERELTNVTSNPASGDSSEADTPGSSAQSQQALAGSRLTPRCGLLKTLELSGAAAAGQPNIKSHYKGVQYIKDSIHIDRFQVHFRIHNSVWAHPDTETDRSFSSLRGFDRFSFSFNVPVWTADVNPNYKYDVDFWGYKGPREVKCHSSLLGYAKVTQRTLVR